MNDNPHLVQRLSAIQQVLVAHKSGGTDLPNAMIGDERETFVREFLGKLFPAHRRFSTGVITDSSGGLSGQVDIAIEYGLIPSFPMPSTDERLLLADGVALVLEVKSNLSAQWSEVESTTRAITALSRKVEPIMQIGTGPSATIPVIAIGYTGYATTDGLSQRLNNTPADSRPVAALSIDSGCFAGMGMATSGPLGLYALCVAINDALSELVLARPDLSAYGKLS